MSIRIIQADVIAGLAALEDQSVQCVVTSPPYWGLRDYGVEGQIGLEKTPEEYVQRMVEVFREVRRVLRDDGTVWLNIGDGYNANTGAGFNGNKRLDKKNRDTVMDRPSWLKPKDMVGIPWRLAFALQADGWYLRSDIIWSKPNPMPESVTDRPTKAHEYVFLLTKKAKYFYDADAVREAHKEDSLARLERTHHLPGHKWENAPGDQTIANNLSKACNPAGRNRRTVWEIATQPTPEAHFATFPEALVEPCIKAGTSERGCCSVCGAPWVRVVEIIPIEIKERKDHPSSLIRHGAPLGYGGGVPKSEHNTRGWQPSCTCSADVIPCTVLDPFGGSGTVAKVARRLHRDAILIEINPAYVEIMKKCLRLNEQLFEDNQIEVIA
ncbi:MAG: site-specific DNA-methyltransferase [Methanoregulaceae archaeon]|nr:site-specific DNA-methyltransferase [Methanoregulaceae archaeon]